MYRGISAHSLGALKPAFQYAIYERIRRITLEGQTTALSALQAFVLGAIARATADCICYPARTAKTRKQSALKTAKGATAEEAAEAARVANMGSIEVLQHVAKTEGFTAIYRGVEMEVGRGVFSAGLMLMVKERLDSVVSIA